MKFVNCTTHKIVVQPERGITYSYPVLRNGTVARLETKKVDAGIINGVPVIKRIIGEAVGVPEPERGVMYITSFVVAQKLWAKGRLDVVAPGTPIRDNEGRIVATKNLVINPDC